MSLMTTGLFLMIPLLIGGAIHMLVVRLDLLASLAVPINEGAFGRNKTLRGFVAMPLATVVGVHVARLLQEWTGAAIDVRFASVSPLLLGLALGFGYVLAELPNSYVKRRLGIAPGKRPRRNALWFAAMDQADSALGCLVAYRCLFEIPCSALVVFVVLGPVVHLAANLSLHAIGLRKEWI